MLTPPIFALVQKHLFITLFLISLISFPIGVSSLALFDSSFCPVGFVEKGEAESGEETESEEKETKDSSEEYSFVWQSRFDSAAESALNAARNLRLLNYVCLDVVTPPPEV